MRPTTHLACSRPEACWAVTVNLLGLKLASATPMPTSLKPSLANLGSRREGG